MYLTVRRIGIGGACEQRTRFKPMVNNVMSLDLEKDLFRHICLQCAIQDSLMTHSNCLGIALAKHISVSFRVLTKRIS
jgi:hypothetical protein